HAEQWDHGVMNARDSLAAGHARASAARRLRRVGLAAEVGRGAAIGIKVLAAADRDGFNRDCMDLAGMYL
ncbi:MAG TPA: hypothetical protein VFM66_01835, partial [Agromyces sp.]|nr:hypothetical protein [Agromyces sp.]